jgi:hypothetical protein
VIGTLREGNQKNGAYKEEIINCYVLARVCTLEVKKPKTEVQVIGKTININMIQQSNS